MWWLQGLLYEPATSFRTFAAYWRYLGPSGGIALCLSGLHLDARLRRPFEVLPLRYDPATGVMDLAYEPGPTDAPTDSFVSPRTTAGGYVVEVEGAHVTSAPCARHLTLENDPGAPSVHVVVRPGPCAGS